jgi:bisphosphoglycerate-dependent phosphoglycerate mutase
MSNTTLILIRHAEVEAAYQGVFGGTIDMNLSPAASNKPPCAGKLPSSAEV